MSATPLVVVRAEVRAFAPAGLLAAAVARFAASASSKGVALAWEVDDAVPERCVGASECLAEVLSLLVAAALRDTRFGAIAVVARLDGTELALEVADTGVGAWCAGPDGTTALDAERSAARRLVFELGGDLTIVSRAWHGTRCTLRVEALPRGSGTMVAVRRAD